jgi:hypothetical protein
LNWPASSVWLLASTLQLQQHQGNNHQVYFLATKSATQGAMQLKPRSMTPLT